MFCLYVYIYKAVMLLMSKGIRIMDKIPVKFGFEKLDFPHFLKRDLNPSK